MHNKKTFADKAIGYDREAPTAWYTLLFITISVFSFIHVTAVQAHQDEAIMPSAILAEEPEEPDLRETERQYFLAELRLCESLLDDHAVGDSGDSIGPYQVQKPTLEDWLGRKVTYDDYYSIVTDYETIHPLTYEAYFVRGESWRWVNCTKKLNAKGIWAS